MAKKKSDRKPAFNKHGLSRTISQETKRMVRKRCGFGCVICGLGIYEYEHFAPEFKDAHTHDPNGITLLCPNHHAKKTKGLLSRETIERWNNDPKVFKQGFVSDQFDLFSNNIIVTTGTIVFENTPVVLQIDDEPILSITPSEGEDEPYQLSATLRDSNGNTIMEIDKNEWKTSAEQWDCKTIGNRIEIRSTPKNIELIIRHIPPNQIFIDRLVMVHRGCLIEAHESDFTIFALPSKRVVGIKDSEVKNYEIGLKLLTRGAIELGSIPKAHSWMRMGELLTTRLQ